MRVGQALNCRTTIRRRHHYIAAVPVIIRTFGLDRSQVKALPSTTKAEEGGLAPASRELSRARWSSGEAALTSLSLVRLHDNRERVSAKLGRVHGAVVVLGKLGVCGRLQFAH